MDETVTDASLEHRLTAAEAALRTSEELRRMAIEGARMGTWRWDLDSGLIWGDAEFLSLWGFPPSEAPRQLSEFADRMSPAGQAEMRDLVTSAVAAGQDFDGQLSVVNGPTRGRWVRWRGRAEKERSSILNGVSFDVTDQRIAETRLRESEALQHFRAELSDALRGLTSPTEIMAEVARRVGPHLKVDQANYYLIEGDRFVVAEEWRTGSSLGLIGSHRLADFGESASQMMRDDEVLRLDDTRDVEGAAAFAAAGMAAVLSAPLRRGNRWAGGLHVHSVTPRIWTDEEAALVRETGERAWAAIERARVESELRESEARHRFRVELGDALHGLASPPEVMATVAERLGLHLGVDQASYYEVEGDRFVVAEEWRTAATPGVLGSHRLADFGSSQAARLHAGEVIRLNDTDGVDGSDAFASVNIAALLSVPLHRDGRWAAGLHVAQARARVWTDDEEALVREVAAHTWVAIERARAEVALRDSEAQLRDLNDTLESQVAERTAERDQVWNNSRDLLLVLDTDGVFRAVNPAWTTILGYQPDELVGRHVADVVLPDDSETTRGALRDANEDLDLTGFENRYMHKDGSVRWISWKTTTEGDLIYAYGRDVTAEKERQRELDLAQEALRQSQKLEAMGSLTGGVAHDFNNLLTPIIGSLDMLVRKGVGSERERRLIDGALQSAERAKTLVQRLLAFARRQPLQAVAVDVGKLVEGMKGLIGSTVGPTIDVRVDLAPNLPPAKGDVNQLEMALLNLAVNARDAMAGGGELTIATMQDSVGMRSATGLQPGDYICLRVTDTGTGMDEATLQRATEPFFSTKGIGQGTGLGLSMVHGLAAQLGGGMTVRSAPGQGTTIELWLPISGAAVDDDNRVTEPSRGPKMLGKALLVDDEELVRMSTADMLIDLGYEVVETASAEDALQLVRDGLKPNILVTDHLMPGMSGTELARELKATVPEVLVLLISGYAEAAGVDPTLPRLIKPFRNAELAACLSALTSSGPMNS